MPVSILRKVIARRGVIVPKNPLGKRVVKVIDDAWIGSVKDAGNQMLQDGLLIPAPYGHTDDNHVSPAPLIKSSNGSLVDAQTGDPSRWDHAVNAGFWGRDEADKPLPFEVSKGPTPEYPDDQPGDLIGYLRVEGDENDQNTHAGRVGKTFCQTSPWIADWLDGSNKKRVNAPMHICLTNRAVQNDQPKFRKISLPSEKMDGTRRGDISINAPIDPEFSIAMSLDGGASFEEFDFVGDLDYNPSTKKRTPGSREGSSDDRQQSSSSSGNPASQGASNDSGDVGQTSDMNGGEADANDEDESGDSPCNIDSSVVQNIIGLFDEKFGIKFPENTTPMNFADRLLTILTSREGDDSSEEEEEAVERITKPPKGAEAFQAPTVMGLENLNPDDLTIVNGNLTAMSASAKKGYESRIKACLAAGKIGKRKAEYLRKRMDGLQFSVDDLGVKDAEASRLASFEMDLSDIEEGEVGLLEPQQRRQGSYVPNDADDMGEGGEKELSKAEIDDVLDAVLP